MSATFQFKRGHESAWMMGSNAASKNIVLKEGEPFWIMPGSQAGLTSARPGLLIGDGVRKLSDLPLAFQPYDATATTSGTWTCKCVRGDIESYDLSTTCQYISQGNIVYVYGTLPMRQSEGGTGWSGLPYAAGMSTAGMNQGIMMKAGGSFYFCTLDFGETEFFINWGCSASATSTNLVAYGNISVTGKFSFTYYT